MEGDCGMKLLSLKNINWNPETVTLLLLGLSFFVGIWHGLPQLTIIADENYFVGGVLRAMENKTILPAPDDVPYGTLTYFFSYVAIAFYLVILSPFFGFNLDALKSFLIQSPEFVYIIPRALSAIFAMGYLYFIYKLLKREVDDRGVRTVFLILLFTNMLTVLILHTGKMWVLSTLLAVMSFYYLYQTIMANDEISAKRHSLKSIVLGFLAAANFPLNAIFLINIPVLLIWFRKNKKLLGKLVLFSLIGLIIYAGITALNFTSVKNQVISIFTNYNPVLDTNTAPEASVLQSFGAQLTKIFAFFPLLLAMLPFGIARRVKNKKLLVISLVYFLTYFISISVVANWATDLYSYTRYSFPLVFFIFFIILSFNYSFSRWFYGVAAISVLYFVFTIYYLAAPTTYNLAEIYVAQNLNKENAVVVNEIWTLQLPKNKASYELNQEYFCASKCQNVIANDLYSDIKPLIIDKHTQETFELPKDKTIYYLKNELQDEKNYKLLASFSNDVGLHFGVEGRMANYFDWDLFLAKHFGSNIYIYEQL